VDVSTQLPALLPWRQQRWQLRGETIHLWQDISGVWLRTRCWELQL